MRSSLAGVIATIGARPATRQASASHSMWRFFVRFRQKMSSRTVRFSGVKSRPAISSKQIILLSYEFKMYRIAASFVVAYDMVDNFRPRIFWYRSFHSRVHNSMNFLATTPKVDNSIAEALSAKPIPAVGIIVYVYAVKNTIQLLGGKLYIHNNILLKRGLKCNMI